MQSLSLTGRLLYYLADRFVVQWPGLVGRCVLWCGCCVCVSSCLLVMVVVLYTSHTIHPATGTPSLSTLGSSAESNSGGGGGVCVHTQIGILYV